MSKSERKDAKGEPIGAKWRDPNQKGAEGQQKRIPKSIFEKGCETVWLFLWIPMDLPNYQVGEADPETPQRYTTKLLSPKAPPMYATKFSSLDVLQSYTKVLRIRSCTFYVFVYVFVSVMFCVSVYVSVYVVVFV